MTEHTNQSANEDPREFWEQLYAGAAPIWSGRVNRTLAEAVADLPPGRSLDLGCGEGGDVLWLAERGWHATGIDLSETAVQRAREAARARSLAVEGAVVDPAAGAVGNLADGTAAGAAAGAADGVADGFADGYAVGSVNSTGAAVFIAADLADWVKTGAEVDGNHEAFDLITASFLQSPVELPRERILQAALARLAPGGSLVLISHAAPPSWVNDGDSGSGHKDADGGGHRHGHGQGNGHGHGHGNGIGDENGSGGPKFFGPEEELERLGLTRLDTPAGHSAGTSGGAAGAGALRGSLDPEFVVGVAEIRKREVTDPEGKPALIDDSLVIVRRTGGAVDASRAG